MLQQLIAHVESSPSADTLQVIFNWAAARLQDQVRRQTPTRFRSLARPFQRALLELPAGGLSHLTYVLTHPMPCVAAYRLYLVPVGLILQLAVVAVSTAGLFVGPGVVVGTGPELDGPAWVVGAQHSCGQLTLHFGPLLSRRCDGRRR